MAVVALVAGVSMGCGGADGAGSSATTAPEGTGGLPATASPATAAGTATTAVTADTGDLTVGPDDRPSDLVAPGGGVTAPAPLLIVLHGYDRSPDDVDQLLSASEQSATRGMYVLLAAGSENDWGERFWNASEVCCDYNGSGTDDVGYLSAVLDEAMAERPIDPDRVYVVGHSNGGFMAYRVACDLADRVAAVAVVAGADSWPGDGCEPTRPVPVLHLHGDDDGDVDYEGPTDGLTGDFPGAGETVARWAERDGCGDATEPLGEVDLVASVPGVETSIVGYVDCPEGVDVELATMAGAGHEPELNGDAVGTTVLDWLLDHPRRP